MNLWRDGGRVTETRKTRLKELLAAHDNGDADALGELMEVIYPELKKLARYHLYNERAGHTLNTTAIVHEAYLRMSGGGASYQDEGHFLRASSKVMRNLLVDHARRRNAAKRGGGITPKTLVEDRLVSADDSVAVLALDTAIKDMKEIDPRLETIMECRFFAGLSVAETAQAMGTSERTVERCWQRARAYLLQAMHVTEE